MVSGASDPPVVVAVGEHRAEAAVAWAVEEASRRGCAVHLVHVARRMPGGVPPSVLERVDSHEYGREVLDRAAQLARDLSGGRVRVSTELAKGATVPAVSRAADAGCMVVLQHRALFRARRVITRSVTSALAASTRVPVVAVPEDWGPEATHGIVSVGVEDPGTARALLREAVNTAVGRGARLRILHAAMSPDVYSDSILTTVEIAEVDNWLAWSTAALHGAVDDLVEESGVDAEVEVTGDAAADLLIEATGSSELLLLGRHEPNVPYGSHPGPVVRAVIREAQCPVVLVSLSEPVAPGDTVHRDLLR